MTHVKFIAVDIFQFDSHRTFPRIFMINIAGTVRGEIGLSILVMGYLVFPDATRQG